MIIKKGTLMIDHMKGKHITGMKVDMMTENEIMFKKNTHHQETMTTTGTKRGTRSHLLDHDLHHHKVLDQGEVVVEIIKGIMKIKVKTSSKEKIGKMVRFLQVENKVGSMMIRTDKKTDLIL